MGNPFASPLIQPADQADKPLPMRVPPLPYAAEAKQHLDSPLPEEAMALVNRCRDVLAKQVQQTAVAPAPVIASPAASFPGLARRSAAARTLMQKRDAIERQGDETLYTQENYEQQLSAARQYLDAFVEDWKGALPSGGKDALRSMLGMVVEGSAGAETGWSAEVVKNCANRRPHTGVFQTGWSYLHDAAHEIALYPGMEKLLDETPADRKMLALAKEHGATPAARGMPTSSFAAQGAAFAAMTARSYRLFLKQGGDPDAFDGMVLYFDHLLGLGGGQNFRTQLARDAEAAGKPGLWEAAYNGNFLITPNPRAPLNDLNPARTTFPQATARDVERMTQDKFVLLYVRMEDSEADPARMEAFQKAFLPQWRDAEVKAQDTARVRFQKQFGNAMRATDVGTECPCEMLRPMPTAKEAEVLKR